MYAALAFFVVLAYLLVTVVVPFRFVRWPEKLLGRLQGAVLDQVGQVSFHVTSAEDKQALLWIRLWGGASAALFTLFGIFDGALIRNHPQAIATVGAYAILAMVLSGILLLSGLAYTAYLPRARGFRALNRCGFQALSVVDCLNPSKPLRERLSSQVRGTARVGSIDVTGYELFGKGPGPAGGLLYDALDAVRHVPVYLLLLKPESLAPDPEGRKATVFQSLLAEMNITPSNYMRRVRVTLEAIEALNENRPDEAKIRVRYYNEIPALRAVIFEESAIVFPWQPREGNNMLPFLEVARKAEEPTLYETFRRHLVRLWAASASESGSGSGSQAVRAKSAVIKARAPQEQTS
ncbi:MAG: hypothetical protein HY717_03335 [Planctomycetes bacterium]|nr:hypothetical protein [Planctomycetota bacterium]